MIPLKLNIHERLGVGAFGEVWAAEDENLRPFAVKFFGGDTAEASLRSALAHANALIRVRHPAIVRIHAIAPLQHPSEGLQLALVMEYVVGAALSALAEPLSLRHALTAMHHMAAGLEAIHEEGLVHGDLHAGNVIVTSSSAKLIDLFYAYTQAGEDRSERQRTRIQDIRDFAKLGAELFRHVPELQEAAIARALERAQDDHVSAAQQVAQAFGALAGGQAYSIATSIETASAYQRRPLPNDVDEFYLVLSKLDRWGLAHVTHVVGGGRALAAYPGVLLATATDLFTLRHTTREIELIKGDYLEQWRNPAGDPPDSAYVAVRIADADLQNSNGTVSLPVASLEPAHGSRPGLFEFSRLVSVQGLVGPYLFIEESDWQYAGGAHPDTTCRFVVLDVQRGTRIHDLLTEEERSAAVAREGLVAKAAFKTLREGELVLPEEFDVDLASICPFVQMESGVGLRIRFLFTAPAAYTTSDRRWSSYTISEEVPARRLPSSIAGFSDVPSDIHNSLRTGPGTVIGWSAINRSHRHFSDLIKLLSE